MPGVVTSDRLRELAAFRAKNGCAVSLYLGFDPSTSGTVPAALAKINALLDEAHRAVLAARPALTHEQTTGLEEDYQRIRDFLEHDFDRSGVRGVAIFAAGLDGFWQSVALNEPVPDVARVGSELYVAPLVPLLGRGDGVLVAVVDRERGLLYKLTGGRLEELADHSDDVLARMDQGGWSQARYQRHVDELAARHLRTVADDLDARVHNQDAIHVVVIGPEETRTVFLDLLAHETREALAGATAGEGWASPTELLELVRPFVEQSRLADETERLARWQEEQGRNGRATAGWADTLEALSDARVDVLLFQDGIERRVFQCPKDGRAQAEDGACPLDGTTLEPRDDGVDVAVHLALANGGRVHALTRDRPELGPFEGIAALLRF
jgi:peptide chain release factor subunit 1